MLLFSYILLKSFGINVIDRNCSYCKYVHEYTMLFKCNA
jgi:hypothetical protein